MKLEGALHLRRGAFVLDSGPFAFDLDGITVLFGASGAGKTTLLRAIAGLEPGTRGTLRFGDEAWLDGTQALPAAQRGIGFVFQDAALFPHLSVRGNLRYAQARSRANGPDLHEVAAWVGVTKHLDQTIDGLSGGERQRVAIARALLSNPRLLCMDEPLSSLDWRARAELLPMIDALARDTGLPVLYVTHTPREVERLASRVAFVADGRIQRIESLRAALARIDSPLFEEEGAVSVLEGRVDAIDADGLLPFVTPGNVRLRLAQAHDRPPSQASRLRILAKDVSLALREPRDISILNHLPVTLQTLSPERNGRVVATLRLPDHQSLLSEITAHSARALQLRSGQSLYALIKSVALID